MASSDLWTATRATAERIGLRAPQPVLGSREQIKLWMVWDALIVVVAASLAWSIRFHINLQTGARHLLNRNFAPGEPLLLTILAGFIVVLLVTCRHFHLYSRRLVGSLLSEQFATLQACVISGLLLTGSLYVFHASQVPRRIVFLTLAMVTVGLSLRRVIYRLVLYRGYERGVGTRNLLIMGTGPEAQDLRRCLESNRHCGFTFMGFITPESAYSSYPSGPEVVSDMDGMFDYARQHFIDEIFVSAPVDSAQMREMLFRAHEIGIDLRLIPEQFGGLTTNSTIEYIGNFPTIPLHRSNLREFEQALKSVVDIVLSVLILATLSPLMLLVALLIKLDSPGPIFYFSERLGKKGRIFKCIKFRSMCCDADKRRTELAHHNQRDGILFKMENDPRVTRVGRFLRKYSLDELPQFINVLKGEMSVVGPRPPLGSEVKQYQLHHLRRLNATPGITGLWQVQARRDSSFDNYISLDLAYIENWSIWLDLKIILRTISVVLEGSGC
jgi:exopolysaccharide biosynthesis polyprenyl glycosylphosphotransferase